jgi:hypothetical protein
MKKRYEITHDEEAGIYYTECPFCFAEDQPDYEEWPFNCWQCGAHYDGKGLAHRSEEYKE